MRIREVAIGIILLPLLLGADYSGKYKGALESSSGSRQDVTATIRQKGDRVTGSIGPSAIQQTPLQGGRIENGQLLFEIAPFGGLHMTFPEAGKTLSGAVRTRDGRPPVFDRVTLKRTGPLTLADITPSLPNEGPFRSMRILSLRGELERNHEALNEFWESVKQTGAPLVEPDPSDERFQYATFLWRGKPEHKNVLVMSLLLSMAHPADFFMVNLPSTDLWFRTIRLPRGARLEYRLSPNDPLGTMPPGDWQRGAVKDLLNPKGGFLELPGASPQPYYERRDAPKMVRHEHKLMSEKLNQERQVLVYTPPGYDAHAKPYPLIYFFDGEDADGVVFASWTLENLMAGKKIPPVVVVRIVNPNRGARQLLAAHDRFFDFLSKELVLFVRANYNVSRSQSETAIAGYSLGGFAAAYAGLRHPDLFGLILSQSGSFWYEPTGDETAEPTWLAKKFVAAPKLPLRFYMDAGLFELDFSGRGSGILLPNRHLRDVLRAKGYEVKYQEFPGGHDTVNWRGTLADGLITLFGQVR
jgi:enterochelin esterase family protein